mmetsp:Transcript_21563/g.50537  ORF Transcript_21563/g.50537 Transcript_21563/m.50537 type:complete len:225 (-) Transcript_21563:194-868(-)
MAPNYTFEEAREVARGAGSRSAGWDPALGRGASKDIPSHADITKHYPPDQHKNFPARLPFSSGSNAAPCLKDDLKATLDVYDRSRSAIAASKRDWMQGGQDVVAKVAGNLTLRAERVDELLNNAAVNVAIAKAVASLASVKPESTSIILRTPISGGDKAGNLIARYSINILGTDSYSGDSVAAVVKTQSAAKVTEELMRHLTEKRSGGNVQAIGLSMRVELPFE